MGFIALASSAGTLPPAPFLKSFHLCVRFSVMQMCPRICHVSPSLGPKVHGRSGELTPDTDPSFRFQSAGAQLQEAYLPCAAPTCPPSSHFTPELEFKKVGRWKSIPRKCVTTSPGASSMQAAEQLIRMPLPFPPTQTLALTPAHDLNPDLLFHTFCEVAWQSREQGGAVRVMERLDPLRRDDQGG